MTHVLLLLRLPFLFCGCVLGAGLWWVTRRLYGNLGGYVALALYCFSPSVLKACVSPNPDIFAALGVYGGIYTCIGVAHAMQGPRRKWRPRIILLTVLFGIAAAAHIAAFPVTALLGLVLMIWIAEGRRSQLLPVVLLASAGALVLLFACYGFSPDAFSYVFRSAAGFLSVSLVPARRFFSTFSNVGVIVACSCLGVALSWRAALALFWQHRSASLLPRSHSAHYNRCASHAVALVSAIPPHVCWRSICGRFRVAARKNLHDRRRLPGRSADHRLHSDAANPGLALSLSFERVFRRGQWDIIVSLYALGFLCFFCEGRLNYPTACRAP